ncbi:MAG TPA: MerR family transcriptional regulator [Kofleriaceae bacterium]|nr:MerR family transcriptional regulator [Kofleriaceae bacterium]
MARARPATAASRRLVRISDLAALSGVPTATIKHYLREGLLPGPDQRSGRTMAYYDARLAERVKAIKELQQSRFLPLKVIAELLEPSPSGKLRAQPSPSAEARPRRVKSRTRKDLIADASFTPADLDALAQLGLVAPAGKVDGEPIYAGADLELLELLDEIRRRGLGDVFPLSALEPYAAATRALVRVELEMLRRRILAGAKLPSSDLDQVARDATALGERLIVTLRAKLIGAELSAVTRTAPEPARVARPKARR